MKQVTLHDYSITVEENLSDLKNWIDEQQYSQFIILVDENTKKDCWPIFKAQCHLDEVQLIEIKSGEVNKNIDTCQNIWKQLLDLKVDRNALFINLGGGVIGDMGGFAASCYKRGIDFVNVPTTVLAQVDASIGGKLGIDFQYGKNLIGLFKNPKRIHISKAFHQTLSNQQYNNGFAEIYKHALIGDKVQWEMLRAVEDLRQLEMDKVLYDSLLIKKRIVEEDPFEKGIRKALNFGHTIGHAIETYSLEHDETPLLHGEAIVIGMIMEAFLSVEKVGLSKNELKEIINVLRSKYIDYQIDSNILGEAWQYMLLDKKNDRAKVMSALISSIGTPVINVELSQGDLKNALEFYSNL
ncbi:MAG: 3-dehydroquinate synthase [Chitinophagales bacterium]